MCLKHEHERTEEQAVLDLEDMTAELRRFHQNPKSFKKALKSIIRYANTITKEFVACQQEKCPKEQLDVTMMQVDQLKKTATKLEKIMK